MRAAASRTFCTAGRSRPIRIAMMAMTTSNSISVKAQRTDKRCLVINKLPEDGRISERERGREPRTTLAAERLSESRKEQEGYGGEGITSLRGVRASAPNKSSVSGSIPESILLGK